MTKHGNASPRQQESRTLDTDLKRRARKLVSDSRVDPKTRSLIRYGLAIKDEHLEQVVNRVESGETSIDPRLRPGTRFFLACVTTGTRRATGVPCSVMITSLPAKACASKSGNLFWASSTLTVRVIPNPSQLREHSIIKGFWFYVCR
jgi:hypothetical protein